MLRHACVGCIGAGVVRRVRIVVAAVGRDAGALHVGIVDATRLALVSAGLAKPLASVGFATRGGRAVIFALVVATAGLAEAAAGRAATRARTPGRCGRIADRSCSGARNPMIAVCADRDAQWVLRRRVAGRVTRNATPFATNVSWTAWRAHRPAGHALAGSANGTARCAQVPFAAGLSLCAAGATDAPAIATRRRIVAD